MAGLVVGCVFAAGIIIALIVATVCCFPTGQAAQGQVFAMGQRTPTPAVQQTVYPGAPLSYTESVSNAQSGKNVSQESAIRCDEMSQTTN